MSLRSKVYRINNSFITAFALLDSWCDRDAGFLFTRNQGGIIPFEALKDMLTANDYYLSLLNDTTCIGEQACFNLLAKMGEGNLIETVPAHFRLEWLARIGDPTVHTLRTLLREQLFGFLCLLDVLHSKRLDPGGPDMTCQQEKGFALMEHLIAAVSESIKKSESDISAILS